MKRYSAYVGYIGMAIALFMAGMYVGKVCPKIERSICLPRR